MQRRTEIYFRVPQRIIWRHIIKINDYPKPFRMGQNPAYRHKHIKNHS
jgi:hypothetical protein